MEVPYPFAFCVGVLLRGSVTTGTTPLVRGGGACCNGGGPEVDARGNLEPGAAADEPLVGLGACPRALATGPFSALSFGPLNIRFGPSGGPAEGSLGNIPLLWGIPVLSPLGRRAPGTRSPDGVCWIC